MSIIDNFIHCSFCDFPNDFSNSSCLYCDYELERHCLICGDCEKELTDDDICLKCDCSKSI